MSLQCVLCTNSLASKLQCVLQCVLCTNSVATELQCCCSVCCSLFRGRCGVAVCCAGTYAATRCHDSWASALQQCCSECCSIRCSIRCSPCCSVRCSVCCSVAELQWVLQSPVLLPGAVTPQQEPFLLVRERPQLE